MSPVLGDVKIKPVMWALDLLFILFAFHAGADVQVTKPNAYWICRNGKQVRTIRVVTETDSTFTTYYSKNGAEKSVGHGRNLGSCMGFLENVKTNLEKSGWVCRDVTNSEITLDTE